MKSLVTATALALCLSSAAQAEGKLNLYVWADSVSPALIEKFSREHEVEVHVDGYTSNEDLLTKLQAGSSGYDVVTPSQHFLRIMIDQGLLENYGANQLAAFDNIDPRWRNQWWDEGQDYSIPFAYGTAGFVVNTDVYKGPTDSLRHFFEPEGDLVGKIAMLSQPDEVIGAAQLYLGIPFCTENPDEMKKVLDLLQAQKPAVAVYSGDNIASRLASGEVAAHFWWDGEELRARDGGAPVKMAMTSEGLVGWIDSLAIPKGAANRENAIKFIEFISQPENATEQMNFYAHSSPMMLVADKVVYTREKAPELYPEVPVQFSRTCSPAAQDLVTRVWTQLMQ
ncbi:MULTISPECIES: extracellular solute-binding protein [unclassified Paracoccus (in: a-proteobacteria)]|uniref:extracellular solute-binding protein n=1 Tax=unclassified Paracoccus (in: a-proteobacteria) TaxID=2688777 RepID=UPI0012B334EC|nr:MULTISPECIES: extracellular solute-binding protein [unclassified Paracoccus (in: a-proteobacteria)]UXU76665.1 extracellular solute-binding protein [Paracoccus sp. SMMA_5]UXU82555.1 extracellular solute-binding protein [Paracoccus sp. SMMA_5_TC]